MISRRPCLALLVLLAACTHVGTVRLGPERYEPVDPGSVRFFATVVPEHYTEVAVIGGNDFLSRESHVADAMRKAAARLGANGIILTNLRQGTLESASAVKLDSNIAVAVASGGDTFGRAVAIRYDPATLRTASAPSTAPPPAAP